MIELLTSPEAWAALLTLTALEIVLGIDNVIFLSVIVSRIPQRQATQARQIGLALALVFRILLLSLLVWLIGGGSIFAVKGVAFFLAGHHSDRRRAVSDRQGDCEIHAEVERATKKMARRPGPARFLVKSSRSSSSIWCSHWTPSSPRSVWRRISRS
jgi:predicted tellurium resistance membrane protein TerC